MADTRARDRFYVAVAVLLMAASWPLHMVWLQAVSVVVAMMLCVVILFAATFGS